jgi:Xaa-Pro aminopeptidase
LGRRLADAGVDAFIAEPGGTTQYFTNFSNAEWELSERPFLLVVTPKEMFFLAPLFEVSRAKMLNIPVNETRFVTWVEGAPVEIVVDHRCIAIYNVTWRVARKGKDYGGR